MKKILNKYLDILEKLSTFIEHKFGVKPLGKWIYYDNVVDIAIELLESQKFEVKEYEPWMEDAPEWFKIQTVNPDRNLFGDTVYCVRKIEEIEELGNSTIITCGEEPTDHKCNEDAICYDTNERRFFFKDSKEADKWHDDNYKDIRGGSVACSICGRAAIDNVK